MTRCFTDTFNLYKTTVMIEVMYSVLTRLRAWLMDIWRSIRHCVQTGSASHQASCMELAALVPEVKQPLLDANY
jgi:hypothetical protein